MLTCSELIAFLSEYLSGTLPPGERARLDEHLAVCPSCVAYLAQFGTTVRLAREAFSGEDAPPEDVPCELIRAVLDARRQRD